MNMAWNKIKTKNTKFPFDMTPPKVYMQRKKDENSLEFWETPETEPTHRTKWVGVSNKAENHMTKKN